MRTPMRFRPGLAAALVLLASSACGGGDLTLPTLPSAKDFHISPVGDPELSGRVGDSLPDPLTVVVRDATERPVAGWRVTFAPVEGPVAGTLEPALAETDANGRASTYWRLGTVPGTYTAEARLDAPLDSAPQPVHFTAVVRPGLPDTLRAVSDLELAGRRTKELEDPVTVAVVDRYGNATPGVDVAWTLVSGEGEVTAAVTATDQNGEASVRWRLGSTPGVQELAASVEGVTGSPVVFRALVVF